MYLKAVALIKSIKCVNAICKWQLKQNNGKPK